MGQGKGPEAGHQHHRLGVANLAAAGGRITVMANGQIAGQALEHLLVKDLAHQAHVLVQANLGPLESRNPSRFLAPVLQGVEAEIGEVGHRLARGQHGKHSTGFFGLIRPFRLLERH